MNSKHTSEQTEPFQKMVKKKHRKGKIRLIGLGKNKKKPKGWKKPSYERSKSAPPMGEEKKLDESMFFNLSSFEMHDELSSKIWDGHRLKKKVKEALLEISKDFFESLQVHVEIEDITFTGSLANYNWTEFSDIDLHIVLNFRKISDNLPLVRDYFTAKRNEWNMKHEIMIKDHEVEIYMQESTELHASTGVYSVLKDQWIIEPSKVKPVYDEGAVYKKASGIANMVTDIENLFYQRKYDEVYEFSKRIFSKIKKMRSAGLKKVGEFSAENLAFKILRRNKYLEKLAQLRDDSYDEKMSLNGAAKRDLE
tara:strand:+ start:494 stop:1420 length:927 start_codon:yes stop_codon:yes gene_type:complete